MIILMMIPWVKAQGASVLCEVCKHVGRVEETHLDIIIIIITTIIMDILIIIVVEKRMVPFNRILP